MVGTGDGSIILNKIQIEGKNIQTVDQFIKGYPDFINSELGTTS